MFNKQKKKKLALKSFKLNSKLSYLTKEQENRFRIQNEENERIQQAQLIFWEARKRTKLKKAIESRQDQDKHLKQLMDQNTAKSKVYFDQKQYKRMIQEFAIQRKLKEKERQAKDKMLQFCQIPGVEFYNATGTLNKPPCVNLEANLNNFQSNNLTDKKILLLEAKILSPRARDPHAPARYFSQTFTQGFGVMDAIDDVENFKIVKKPTGKKNLNKSLKNNKIELKNDFEINRRYSQHGIKNSQENLDQDFKVFLDV